MFLSEYSWACAWPLSFICGSVCWLDGGQLLMFGTVGCQNMPRCNHGSTSVCQPSRVRSRPDPFLIILLNTVNLSCSLVPSFVTWATADALLGLIGPLLLYPGGVDTKTQLVHTHVKSLIKIIYIPQLWGLIFWIITDWARLFPSGPSTPPEELQLNALDSSSVLVSWRPPLEPNGIIIGYFILYSGNLSHPDDLWEKLSQDGDCLFTALKRQVNLVVKIVSQK